MESAQAAIKDRFRFRLILGKFPIIKIEPGLGEKIVTLRINEGISLTAGCPLSSDVRIGDILTLYTEVLAKEPKPNA